MGAGAGPGLNHLAFHAGSTDRVDHLVDQAPEHGWQVLFADRHPHAGGPQHYAGFLENTDGYEVELVADTDPVQGVVREAAPRCW